MISRRFLHTKTERLRAKESNTLVAAGRCESTYFPHATVLAKAERAALLLDVERHEWHLQTHEQKKHRVCIFGVNTMLSRLIDATREVVLAMGEGESGTRGEPGAASCSL